MRERYEKKFAEPGARMRAAQQMPGMMGGMGGGFGG